jgi:endonuclease-3
MKRNFNEEAIIIIENYPYKHHFFDPFKILISTILSQRTKDENMLKASYNLFEKYDAPEKLSKALYKDISDLIKPAGMYNQKSKNIIETSKIIVEKYNSIVPNTIEELVKLPGVGRKTANIVLFIGYKIPTMAVDTHVHRIANRLEWIDTKKTDDSELELMKVIEKELWGPLNGCMVAFGQQTCKPQKPLCNNCPLNKFCPHCEKVGK